MIGELIVLQGVESLMQYSGLLGNGTAGNITAKELGVIGFIVLVVEGILLAIAGAFYILFILFIKPNLTPTPAPLLASLISSDALYL